MNKTRAMLLLLVMTVLGSSLIAQAVAVQPLVWKEYIGRQTVTQYVPTFVLYDPPGGGSYSKASKYRTHTSGLKYGGAYSGLNVDGVTTQQWTTGAICETPKTERKHYVICTELEQTWDLWCYIYPRRVIYKAILVSATSTGGIGFIGFDRLSDYDLWVDNLIGTKGDYSKHRTVTPPGSLSDKFEYYQSDYSEFGAGYFLNLYGVEFKVYIEITTQESSKVEILYYYQDDNEVLDFYVESNYDINWSESQPRNINGINIWFDQ